MERHEYLSYNTTSWKNMQKICKKTYRFLSFLRKPYRHPAPHGPLRRQGGSPGTKKKVMNWRILPLTEGGDMGMMESCVSSRTWGACPCEGRGDPMEQRVLWWNSVGSLPEACPREGGDLEEWGRCVVPIWGYILLHLFRDSRLRGNDAPSGAL